MGARSLDRARAFAERFDIPRAYGSYEELVADSDIDVVHIGTLHHTHYEHARLALEAGKAVLLEKAFTLDQRQARDLADLAEERGLFLMEAMWTRFLPHMIELRNRVASGAIGEPRYLHADFGFHDEYDPKLRFYDITAGGGSLLDRGIYCLSWVANLVGLPQKIAASATLAPNGVDAQISAILDYPAAQALIESAVNISTPQEAWIAGTKGMIKVGPRFWSPAPLEIHVGDAVETWTHPTVAAGYEYEVAEVARCVAAGETSSSVMPVEETVALMGVMDEMRRQAGVHFPGE